MLSVENNLRKAKKYSDNANNQYIPKYLIEKLYNLLNFKKYDELIYEALKLRSNFPCCSNLTSILGSAYFKINNFDEAIVYFKRSINLQNNNLDNYYNAGLTLMKLKKIQQANKYFCHIINLNPNYFEAYNELANIEKLKKNYVKALKLYRASLKFRKNLHFTFTNIATLYKEVGKNNSAVRYYHKALDIKKNYSEALFNLSILQLYFNQFQEGWCNYGKSFEINSLSKIKKYNMLPSFDSSVHKSVLVWPEQGIGDQILFSRFFNNLHNSDIKIYSSIDKKLLPLFRASFPFIDFVSSGDKLTTQSQSSIGGLGKFFINSKEDLKNNSSAYLSVNKDKSSSLKAQFPKGKKVCGLSWLSKNDDLGEHKSLSLKKLEKLLKLKDITFVDLQYGDTSKERQSFYKKYGINLIKIKEIDNYDDIEGLAALIDACDFVVTVSNTTAHIAGAIGKKTYLMLPKGKGKLWYWSKESDQSLWYKSIKIMEQKEIGQWNEVIDELCAQKFVV